MKIGTNFILFAFLIIGLFSGCYNNNIKTESEPIKVKIILGSTRQGRSSDTIAQYLERLLANRNDIIIELIDLKDYNLDFLSDETPPARRAAIVDPVVKRWSDTIADADAFIILVPEYNAGYPGVLKNALDVLYNEWNGKPVGFVGYSGGPTGGSSAVSQLRVVTKALKMVPVNSEINIPTIWKAFDGSGNLADATVPDKLNTMVHELKKAHSSK